MDEVAARNQIFLEASSLETFTGKQFSPLQPRVEDIDIRDIAHGLSQACRFANQCQRFLSVAEHSLRVSERVDPYRDLPLTALAGLLHDASEAYLCDFPRPLKHHSAMGHIYCQVESVLSSVIERAFGLPIGIFDSPTIKNVDNDVLIIERDWNMFSGQKVRHARREFSTVSNPLHFYCPDEAESRFLARFCELRTKIKEREIAHGI